MENRRSRVYCFCAVRSYHRSSRSAPNTRSSEARTMTEIGLFATNLSNTAPSIGGLLEGKIEEGLSYTISPHLYTTALLTYAACNPMRKGIERVHVLYPQPTKGGAVCPG